MSIPATPDVPPATGRRRISAASVKIRHEHQKLPSPHMFLRLVTVRMSPSVLPQQGEPDETAQVLRALAGSFDGARYDDAMVAGDLIIIAATLVSLTLIASVMLGAG